MGQKVYALVPMLIFALLASVLSNCSKHQKDGAITSDKTISIQHREPIISRMYYATSDGIQTQCVSGIPKPEDLDYLDYWTITFKGNTDTLGLSCKGANGALDNVCYRYKFENGFLKVFNPNKPLWEVIGYGDKDKVSFFVDYVVYKDRINGPFWINLDFCPDITMEEALQLDESDLFSTVSNLTLGNIDSHDDLKSDSERIYWRVVAYVLE